jgi:hypothetical protein
MIHPQTIRRRRLRLVFGAALVVSLLIALLLIWQNRATAAGDVLSGEAFPFNHQKHIAAGVQCVFCHPGVLNGAVAGLPSVQKCVGCHQNIQVAGGEGQATVDLLMQVWDQGRPLRWEKTYDQPDFVYFTHRPHIAGGVNCENCHGDVGRTRSALRLNMGFCLQCHRQQEPEKMVRLVSCATCHQ